MTEESVYVVRSISSTGTERWLTGTQAAWYPARHAATLFTSEAEAWERAVAAADRLPPWTIYTVDDVADELGRDWVTAYRADLQYFATIRG